MERVKVIIDTDPGVDDNFALLCALNDDRFDIKLISISNGNVDIHKSTRNALHLLDVFNKDIPVVEGYAERYGKNSEAAYFLHGSEGLGNYIPPKETEHKELDADCADTMYETLKKYSKDITLVVLGPHTNVARLLEKYPDAKEHIREIVMMGGAPDGILTNPNHTSFNIRTDAPSFQITINSGLPIVMCPSRIGRDVMHFTNEQFEEIKNSGIMGRYLAKTFETYWEIGYPDKRISTCDISTIYYVARPDLYTTKRCDIILDLENTIGKTTAVYKEDGQFALIKDVNREEMQKIYLEMLDKTNKMTITNEHFLEKNSLPNY